jgi:hypothetical protein
MLNLNLAVEYATLVTPIAGIVVIDTHSRKRTPASDFEFVGRPV